MGKITIDGKEYIYTATHSPMDLIKIKIKIRDDRTFRNVFLYNMTEDFMTTMRGIVNPKDRNEENTIWNVRGDSGCQPAGSKVLMANGEWKNIKEIKVGDLVLSPQQDGSYIFSPVIHTTNWFSTENYQIQETNKSHRPLYKCSHNHILPIIFRHNIKKDKSYIWYYREFLAKELTTKTDKCLSNNYCTLSSFLVPNFLGRVNCSIEPYSLGIYLSDGHFRYDNNHGKQLAITTSDENVIEYISKFYKYMRIVHNPDNKAKSYYFSTNYSKCSLGFLLEMYGLLNKRSGDKFIPKSALLSDSDYRKKLLAGLIDGDGYCSDKGGLSISTKSKQLAEDIVCLVYSLGGRASIKPITKGIKKLNFIGHYFNVSLYIHNLKLPQLVQRKIRPNFPFFYIASNRVAVKPIKLNESFEVYGFSIDSPSNLYITDNWIITHNSGKSMATISLAKQLTPKTFTHKNVVFYDQQVLDTSKTIPRDSFIIRDEAVKTFGTGSGRIASDTVILSETCRKHGMNLAFLSPSERDIPTAKYILDVVDKDYQNRITRVAIKDPATNNYLGALYIKVLPEDDFDWVEYNKAKDDFITSVREGNRMGGKGDYKSIAIEMAKKIDCDNFRSKKQRLAFLQAELTNLTRGEIDIIATFMEIVIENGEEALDDINNGKEA